MRGNRHGQYTLRTVVFEGLSFVCNLEPWTEFKEFEPRLFWWFPLNLFQIFQEISRRSIETGFWGNLRRGLNSLNSDTVDLEIVYPITQTVSFTSDFLI